MSKQDIINNLREKPPMRPDMPTLSEINSERMLFNPVRGSREIRKAKRMYVGDRSEKWKIPLALVLGGVIYAIIGGGFKKYIQASNR